MFIGFLALALAGAQDSSPSLRIRTVRDAIETLEDRSEVKPGGVPAPLGDPGSWATPSDYPAAALREDAEGASRFTLAVDMKGMPTACTITQTSGHAVLDERTCAVLMERARFSPARDIKGNAIGGTWSSSVRWVIPDMQRGAPSPMDYTVSFTVERDGTVTDCSANGLDEFVRANGPCEGFASVKFAPPTDAEGNVVRRRIVLHSMVTNEDLPD